MEKIFVSVIVPVYNVESYLEECIQSILKQNFKNYETILVDDGSTDLSGKICDRYSKKYSNIKVIHKINGGLSSARNAGIEVAQGNYIAFVDSDDVVHQNYLKELVEIANNQDADLVACDFSCGEVCQWEEEVDQQLDIRLNDDVLRKMNDKDVIVTIAWNKLYDKKFFDQYGLRYPEGKIHEDMFLTPQILHYSKKMVITNQKLYFYRQRKNSIMSASFSLKQLDALDAIKFRINLFKQWNEIQLQQNEYESLIRKSRELYKKMKIIDKFKYEDQCNKIRKDMLTIMKNLTILNRLSIKYRIKLVYFLLFEK